MRLDIFRAKQAWEKNIKDSGKKLTPEEQRLVDKMIQDGTRAGLALPEKERNELMTLKKELSSTCLEFSVSIRDTCTVRRTYAKRPNDRKILTKRRCQHLHSS